MIRIYILLFGVLAYNAGSQEIKPLFFDIIDLPANPIIAPVVEPTVVVNLDMEYGGHWVLAGDLDGDGQIEIVSAKNVTYGQYGAGDQHYTSSVVAQKLDGSILWKWGNPAEGRRQLHHDVACQIYDWNGDGNEDVIIAAKEYLIELDGKTGKELRKIPLPHSTAADSMFFCNLNNSGRADDILLKNRYDQIWAIDEKGQLMWTVDKPEGCWIGHSPLPVDVDGDGTDEIFCGFFMLNSDGSLRWKLTGSKVDLGPTNHMDSGVIVQRGKTPQDWLFAISFCSGDNIAVLDGTGKIQWESGGYHYEALDIGQVFPIGAPNIVVDISYMQDKKNPIIIFDAEGRILGRILVEYNRFHRLVDWDGDGFEDILIGCNKGIYNYRGQKIAALGTSEGGTSNLQTGNFMGKGKEDVMFAGGLDRDKVYIFENTNGSVINKSEKLGTKKNFSLY